MRPQPQGEALVPVSLGLRAARGGGVVVGVAIGAGEPRVVLSAFMATAAEGDRLALEPYHLAAEMAASAGAAEAARAIAEGRRRQDELAAAGLGGILGRLRATGFDPVTAAMLVNRAGWISDLLAYSLAAPEHPAVAEGLAVRDALRFALRLQGLGFSEVDEKSLPEMAPAALGRSPADVDRVLAALGPAAGKPWRKDRKLACLAAWVRAATPGGEAA